MRMHRTIATLLAVALVVGSALAPRAQACSAFLLKNGQLLVVGRNYDWHLEDALVMVNKRDIQKTALSFDNPLKWISKYGSVTINQYGRELPCDGMNERGLMIALLWLDETRYPEPDARPSLSNAQWAQYQLDTAATVDEVIASDAHVRITNLGGALVHYFVADAKGNAAVIEFLDGKMRALTGDELPFPAITNRTYSESLAYLRKHTGFGGAKAVERSPGSLDRFVGAARAVHEFAAVQNPTLPQALETIFQTLVEIDQGQRTKWSLAYDLASRTIRFRTFSQGSRRSISLQSLDFGAGTPVQVAEINSVAEGDFRAALVDYTWQANREQIRRACSLTRFAQGLPDFLIELAAKYPEKNCVPVSDGAVEREAALLPAAE
jgi:choloylglycine hydrolase